MAFNFIKFNDKPIFNVKPLVKPKITLTNDFKQVGKNILTKFVTQPTLRTISLEYFIRDLSKARDFESFFINTCKGRLNSFYIPSFKRDFEILGDFFNVNYFDAKRQNSNFGIYNQILNIFVENANFTSKVLDIRVDTTNDYEIVVLDKTLDFTLTAESFVSELLQVRFKSDTFTIEKGEAIGYKVAFELQEVFNE